MCMKYAEIKCSDFEYEPTDDKFSAFEPIEVDSIIKSRNVNIWKLQCYLYVNI